MPNTAFLVPSNIHKLIRLFDSGIAGIYSTTAFKTYVLWTLLKRGERRMAVVLIPFAKAYSVVFLWHPFTNLHYMMPGI